MIPLMLNVQIFMQVTVRSLSGSRMEPSWELAASAPIFLASVDRSLKWPVRNHLSEDGKGVLTVGLVDGKVFQLLSTGNHVI